MAGGWGGGGLVKAQSKEGAAGGGRRQVRAFCFVSFALNYLYNEEGEQIPSCRGVTLKVLPVGRMIACSRTPAVPGGAVT